MTRTLSALLAGGLAVAGLVTVATAQRPRGYSYASGKDLYEHVCQGCHMPGGTGAVGAGAYPPLAANSRLRTPLYPVLVILRGQKAMPSFSELSDAQVTEVTNYIRTSFGNEFTDPVTVDQVKVQRARAVEQQAQRPG